MSRIFVGTLSPCSLADVRAAAVMFDVRAAAVMFVVRAAAFLFGAGLKHTPKMIHRNLHQCQNL